MLKDWQRLTFIGVSVLIVLKLFSVLAIFFWISVSESALPREPQAGPGTERAPSNAKSHRVLVGDSQIAHMGSALQGCIDKDKIIGYSNATTETFAFGSCKPQLLGSYLNGVPSNVRGRALCPQAQYKFRSATEAPTTSTLIIALGDNRVTSSGYKSMISKIKQSKNLNKSCMLVLPSFKSSGHQSNAISSNRNLVTKAAKANGCHIIDPMKALTSSSPARGTRAPRGQPSRGSQSSGFSTGSDNAHYTADAGRTIGTYICQQIRELESQSVEKTQVAGRAPSSAISGAE